MPKRARYARSAITISADVLATVDAIASNCRRSRSRIISEAVRRYAAEAVPAPPQRGLGPLRLSQLAADLRLTPEQRVIAAERTAKASMAPETVRAQFVIGFARLEDYYEWKRLGHLGA